MDSYPFLGWVKYLALKNKVKKYIQTAWPIFVCPPWDQVWGYQGILMHIWTDVLGELPGPASKLLNFSACVVDLDTEAHADFEPSVLNQGPATQRDACPRQAGRQGGAGPGDGKRTDVNTWCGWRGCLGTPAEWLALLPSTCLSLSAPCDCTSLAPPLLRPAFHPAPHPNLPPLHLLLQSQLLMLPGLRPPQHPHRPPPHLCPHCSCGGLPAHSENQPLAAGEWDPPL